MDAENHPDPIQEALRDGLRWAVEFASVAATAAQVYIHKKNAMAWAAAERDERARRALHAQIRADRDAARAGWAPALDPNWLRQADLLQTARAWGAAMPYADRAVPWYEPAAATAMRKCEERLRDLHPHAMARYDRLRRDGMGPAEAMREAAPLFTRPSRVHDAWFTPRPMLTLGNGADLGSAAGEHGPSPPESGPDTAGEAQERRGRQIAGALQERARSQGRDPLGAAELHIVLETVTNLPAEVIDRVVRSANGGLAGVEQNRAAAAEGVRAAGLDAAADLHATPSVDERTENLTEARDAAETADAATARAARVSQPWERDFPVPIHDVVAAAASQPRLTESSGPARTPARTPARGRHL